MKLILILSILLFSGCSSGPDIHERPDDLAKLPERVQVAFVLRDPALLLSIAALIWACNGGTFMKKVVVKAKGKQTNADSK